MWWSYFSLTTSGKHPRPSHPRLTETTIIHSKTSTAIQNVFQSTSLYRHLFGYSVRTSMMGIKGNGFFAFFVLVSLSTTTLAQELEDCKKKVDSIGGTLGTLLVIETIFCCYVLFCWAKNLRLVCVILGCLLTNKPLTLPTLILPTFIHLSFLDTYTLPHTKHSLTHTSPSFTPIDNCWITHPLSNPSCLLSIPNKSLPISLFLTNFITTYSSVPHFYRYIMHVPILIPLMFTNHQLAYLLILSCLRI